MDSVFFNFVDKEKVKQKLASGEFPFSQNLFWDSPISSIHLQKHKQAIIERVITRGSLEDLYTLMQIYSDAVIAENIVKSRILDKKTANFCSLAFNIPKSKLNVSSYYD
jgi:hypothetical protein